jgi:FkbM family methyltransferase
MIKNIVAFKNWHLFYALRYGLIHTECELVSRDGLRLKVRPNTDDLKIVKSNLVTKHYMRNFVPITRDSIVIDVGAHIGAFSVIAAKSASEVFAFEPDQGNCQMLKKNKELNKLSNVHIFNMAISGYSGYRNMYFYSDGSTGSHSLYDAGKAAVVRKRVQTISIDDIIKRERLPRVDFLKLDCEGAEHEILRTMSPETAVKIIGIAMETHGLKGEACIDIPARLQRLGFEVRVEHNGAYVYARRIQS